MRKNEAVRNIAIIAHVDHGKTTLVDAMFRQSGVFREGKDVEERVMDSMDLERERGITIAAKNCSVHWKGVKINIVDTPGHADFGGEVERALSMVDGALLLVDAAEGPLPQTRFVLRKALERDLKLMVLINKVDRKDARPREVLEEIYDLFIDLDATDEQIDFPVFYTIGRKGVAKGALEEDWQDLTPVLDAVVDSIPAPRGDGEAPFQMLVSDLDYSDYLNRLAVGKVFQGRAHINDLLVCIDREGARIPLRVTSFQVYHGPRFREVEEVVAGDIVVLAGIEEVCIGDTIASRDSTRALPRIEVEEPTVSMLFTVNTGPFAGREGRFVQSSKLGERLFKESLKNVSIRVEEAPRGEGFIVKGRGELQMAVLIESMRREGYEFCVGRPRVILKEEGGRLLEPIEHLLIDCDQGFAGVVTEGLSQRKGQMINFQQRDSGRVRLEFLVPSRSLIGYRNQFLTDTKGTGIMSSYLHGYQEHRGEIPTRFSGSIVCDREGVAVAYALFHLEARGELFIEPGTPVYQGMVIGEHNRDRDIDVNPCKEKRLSNMRAAGKDDNVVLRPVRPMTIERAITFIKEDEMVEITPSSIRLRKTVLSTQARRHHASSFLKAG